MKMKKTVDVFAVTAVALLASVASAATYYVDNKLSDYTGADGSEAKPFQKIQQAVNKAVNGDTVLVAPGTYGDDQGYVAKADAMGYYDCRLCIAKNITIVGAGRGKTILLGKLADTDTKSGTGALPGLLIGMAGKNCRISGGFSLCPRRS